MTEKSALRVAVDVNTFIGGYPFRHLPHPEPAALASVMEREGIAHAVVGYLPVAWHRSVTEGNRELYAQLRPHRGIMSPAPAINPLRPSWERELQLASDEGSVAARIYPSQWGQVDTAGSAFVELATSCAERHMPIIMTTRFEDSRQRSSIDTSVDVDASAVRSVVRASGRVHVLLTCAGRGLIEEIHWSLTPEERVRIWYDISWIWGAPQNDLAHLFRQIGSSRFLFGSMWPLRLVQTPFALLELLPADQSGDVLADASEVMPRLKGR